MAALKGFGAKKMNVPAELYYHPEHTWARLLDGVATVGVTDFAQSELGDVVFVELPEAGLEVTLGLVFGSIESSKSVSELFSPVAGTVIEVNAGLEESPEAVNDDPYGAGWIMKVRLAPDFDPKRLLDAAGYSQLLAAGQPE